VGWNIRSAVANRAGFQRIDRLQHPHRFREREVRNPRARRDERFGGGNRGRTCVSNGRLRYSDRLIASSAASRACASPCTAFTPRPLAGVSMIALAGHLLPVYVRSHRRALLLCASGALRCYATFCILFA